MPSNSVPDSFLIHSGTEITYADPVFCTLLGAESADRLVGLSLTDVVAPRYHAPLREQAMNEAPVGITISDPSQPDGPLIYVNDGFCELIGYSRRC